MAGKKVVPPIALALDKQTFWIEMWYPVINAIIAEFGSVEECVRLARKAKDDTIKGIWLPLEGIENMLIAILAKPKAASLHGGYLAEYIAAKLKEEK